MKVEHLSGVEVRSRRSRPLAPLPSAARCLLLSWLSADVFNVLDNENLSGYSNNSTQSNQIQIGAKDSGIVKKNSGPPRQFQFGASSIVSATDPEGASN